MRYHKSSLLRSDTSDVNVFTHTQACVELLMIFIYLLVFEISSVSASNCLLFTPRKKCCLLFVIFVYFCVCVHTFDCCSGCFCFVTDICLWLLYMYFFPSCFHLWLFIHGYVNVLLFMIVANYLLVVNLWCSMHACAISLDIVLFK